MDIPANTKVPLDHPGNVPGAPAATSNRNIDDIKSNGGQNHNDFHTGEPRHMDGPASGSPGLGKGDKAEDREMAGAVGFGKLDDEIKYVSARGCRRIVLGHQLLTTFCFYPAAG